MFILSSEKSLQIDCPFLYWVILLMYSFLNCLCMLNINHLSDIQVWFPLHSINDFICNINAYQFYEISFVNCWSYFLCYQNPIRNYFLFIFVWDSFAYPFTIRQCLSLVGSCVSWKQKNGEYCFLIQSASLCCLTRELIFKCISGKKMCVVCCHFVNFVMFLFLVFLCVTYHCFHFLVASQTCLFFSST